MTAEEYIENIVSAHANMRWMDASELREILNNVTDMTRKEEREKVIEKAIKAARTVIYPMPENEEQENRIVNNFIKLLEL